MFVTYSFKSYADIHLLLTMHFFYFLERNQSLKWDLLILLHNSHGISTLMGLMLEHYH